MTLNLNVCGVDSDQVKQAEETPFRALSPTLKFSENGAVFQVAVFLFYWEKREPYMATDESDQAVVDTEEEVANALEQLGDVEDSDNPYRSPQI